MRYRGVAILAVGLCLLAGCATVVSDDYSAEFSGNFAVADESGDQPLNHKVLKIDLQRGAGSVTPVGSDRAEVFLTRCVSMIANVRSGDQHELRCVGSDRFIYLFVHGKPGLVMPEATMMKLFKDRHDVTSDSGFVLRRYIPNQMMFTYALARKE
ncbi:hypothetical protein [Paraburkholderia caledonica]|uniref:hypothetical protein n=1 Tax=Paraburkholderia caledonica TaxID=134536 RepID=UPI000B402875|nr:hypothetical protein [Paraburkholderia caledonica]